MAYWWNRHGESVKRAALFIAGVIIGGIGISAILN